MCAILYGSLLLLLDDPEKTPYLQIVGGSFIFNYRVADNYMGFSAIPKKPIPLGSVLEVTFENTAGSEAFVVEKVIGLPDRRISMRSPSLQGVQAHVPYTISLRLLNRVTRAPFWQHEFTLSSNISDDVTPNKPLTVGPGYHRAAQ